MSRKLSGYVEFVRVRDGFSVTLVHKSINCQWLRLTRPTGIESTLTQS